MTEIKYKLYHKPTKTMYYYEPTWGNYGQGGGWIGAVELKEYEKNGLVYQPSNRMRLEPDSCEWLQYTGLLDTNHKEIYEGDIVRDCLQTISKETNHLLTIEFREYTFCFKEIINTAFLGGWHKSIEIIGNIYENSELLQTACSQDIENKE